MQNTGAKHLLANSIHAAEQEEDAMPGRGLFRTLSEFLVGPWNQHPLQPQACLQRVPVLGVAGTVSREQGENPSHRAPPPADLLPRSSG